MKITVHKHKVAGVEGGYRWVVSRTENGKRKRSFYATRKEAENEVDRLQDQLDKTGRVWLSLPSQERDRIIQAYTTARKNKVDLVAALLGGKPAQNGATLKATIDELLTAKRNAGRAEDYVSKMECILGQFAKGREEQFIASVTFSHVSQWLESKKLASWSTLRSALSTLFKFAMRRHYCERNPCDQLEPVRIQRPLPRVFSIEELNRCLAFLRNPQKLNKHSPEVDFRYALPWFVLSTACGLRPEEAEKIEPGQIHFDEGWVRVEITKVRQRRVVYPRKEAMTALKWAMDNGGRLPIHPLARKRVCQRMRDHLGWTVWHKDVTRHSAASYWLAACQSAAEVAESLGNSEQVLKKHYKALVTKEEAREFWECWSNPVATKFDANAK